MLIKQIATGEFRIPRFQRPFVWRDEQRLQLLDSIKHGLPIGSILVWRTTRSLEEYERIGPFQIAASPATGVRTYVIDGHQRLVTIFSALSASPTSDADIDADTEEYDIDISETAAEQLLRGNVVEFLDIRRRELAALERRFVEALGLTYEEDQSPRQA